MGCIPCNNRPFSSSNINSIMSKDRGSTFRQVILCITFLIRKLIEGNRIHWRFCLGMKRLYGRAANRDACQ